MIEEPEDTGETIPEPDPMVATPVLLLNHDPPETPSVKVTGEPR
jgi:hypothetical protein